MNLKLGAGFSVLFGLLSSPVGAQPAPSSTAPSAASFPAPSTTPPAPAAPSAGPPVVSEPLPLAPPPVAAAPVAPPPAAAAPVAPPPVAAAPVAATPITPVQPIQLAPRTDPSQTPAREASRAVDGRAAVRSTPFLDVTLTGLWLEDRFGDPFALGVQGGAYLAELVRVSIRLEMPTTNARDEFGYSDGPSAGSTAYASASSPPTLLYGATVGLVAASSDNFVFSPGLVFLRSDVSDYGSMLGVSIPFEWVTSRGLRFGLELDLARAFGGSVHYGECYGAPACNAYDADRPAGRAFAIRFEMGFGFNRAR